jgi:hypothetical protein
MVEQADYRCTVTILLEDVSEEVARQFFALGAEVEGTGTTEGYIASIETAGPVTLDRLWTVTDDV